MIEVFGNKFTKEQLQQIARTNSMQYRVKTNRFVASNCEFDVNTLKAYSYGWWCFFREIDGRFYFNNYNYSPSTCRHQHKIRGLIEDLMKIGFYQLDKHCTYVYTVETLQSDLKTWYLKNVYTWYLNAHRKLHSKRIRKTTKERQKALKSEYRTMIANLKSHGFTIEFSKIMAIKNTIQRNYRAKEKRIAENRRISREKNRLKRAPLAKAMGIKIDKKLPMINDMWNENA